MGTFTQGKCENEGECEVVCYFLKINSTTIIPVGCVPPACCPNLPACTAVGCEQNS